MGLFDRKGQDAAAAARQQAQAAMQQAGLGGGFDPAEAMRQAGMDPAAAMASPGGMGDMQEQIAERDRIQRLNAIGVPATATVVSARAVGASPGGPGTVTEFRLSVSSGPGAGSTIAVKQSMIGDSAWYQPGQTVTLTVNPSEPQEALISGQG